MKLLAPVHAIRLRAERHRSLIILLASMFLLLMAAFVINYTYTERGVRETYTRSFEQNALTNLAITQASTSSLIKTIMQSNLDSVASFAADQTVISSTESRNVTVLQGILDRQRNAEDEFDNIGILDPSGFIIANSNSESTTQFKTSLKGRDYFTGAIATGKPYISTTFTSALGNYSIAFSAPIYSTNGHHIIGVIFAVTHLDQLHNRINLSSPFRTIHSTVLDANGNIIVESDQASTDHSNIATSDRLVNQVLRTKTADSTSEIDYRNTMSLADVTPIDLGNNNYLFLATYYPDNQLQAQIDNAMSELDNAFSDNLLRDLGALTIAYFLIYHIVRRRKGAL